MKTPSVNHDAETLDQMVSLRAIAAREGFTFATMRAMGMAEASIAFLMEIMGRSAVEQVIATYNKAAQSNSLALEASADHPMPDVLSLARSPEFWSEQFAAAGIRMSARSLREKAVKSGLCYRVDKQVLISPRQIDEIFEWSNSKRHSRSTSGVGSGGSQEKSKRGPASSEFMKAQAKLTAILQKKSGKTASKKRATR